MTVCGKFEPKNIYQYWHIHPKYFNLIDIQAKDINNNKIEPIIEEKWFSGYYGVKEKSIRITFVSKGSLINTLISIN